MATATSLTKQQIIDLAAGWDDVASGLEQTNTEVAQISQTVTANQDALTYFQNITVPALEEAQAQNNIAVANLNDTVLADLQTAVDTNALGLDTLNNATLPGLQTELDSNSGWILELNDVTLPAFETRLQDAETTVQNAAQTVLESPQAYSNVPQPTNPDADGRPLVVGDAWYDQNDNNKQYIWNGVEWATLDVDIPDFSLTVRKFLTTTHMIY